VLLPYDAVTHRSRGFGFVTFADQESLRRVMTTGQYHMLDGNRVQIKPAMSKEQMSTPGMPPLPGQGEHRPSPQPRAPNPKPQAQAQAQAQASP
jgi:RNA recognition motif-containing protein